MYKEHSVFESPDDENIKIWRYLKFTKFASLLDTQSLFFIRADKLDDLFEGSYSKANIRLRPKFSGDVRKASNFYRALRRYTMINSWHINEYESAAMWKLYSKSDEGIAIQSTFKRLKNGFSGYIEHNVYIGIVKYIDYETEWIPEENTFYPFLRKRKSFEHERELRAIMQSIQVKDGKLDFGPEVIHSGLNIPVDLDTLIEKLYVSPTAPEWFMDLVTSIGNKYDLKKEISQSSLADDPPLY